MDLVVLQPVESSGPGIEPMSPVLAGRFLTTGPPRRSPLVVLRLSFFFFFKQTREKDFCFLALSMW